MDTDSGWRRLAIWVVCVVFAAQSGVALGVLIDHRGRELGHTLRLYASDLALPGASAAVRVAVLDPGTGRPARFDDVTVRAEPEGVAVTAPEDLRDAFVVSHVERAPAEPFAWVAELLVGSEDRRTVRADVAVDANASWLNDRATFTGRGSMRQANRSVASGDPPSVRVVGEPPAGCPWRVGVAANGGVVAIDLPNTVLVRLGDGAGGPVPDTLLTGRRVLGGGEVSVAARTDAMGVAALGIVPGGTETWELVFDCAGVPAAVRLEIVPSWDGLVLAPTQTTVETAGEVAFSTVHQRRWGEWHQDVHCDGAWVATQTTPVPAGAQVFGYPELRLAPPETPRLCLQQGYTILLAPDPPRSVSYFLLRARGQDERGAVGALVAAARAHGPPELSDQLGPGTVAALASAPPDAVARFGRWLLDGLPQRFVVAPLLVDDGPAALAEFRAAHTRRSRWLVGVLGADALVLVFAVAGVVIPGAVRQRVAIRAVADTMDDDAEPGLDGASRTVVTLVAGALAVGASLVGIAVLIGLLR